VIADRARAAADAARAFSGALSRLGALTADDGAQPEEHLGCRVLVRGYIADRDALCERFGLAPSRATDGELLVHAFRTWGRDVQAHVVGEYAVVVFDAGARCALITHDALGLAPLFYARRAEGIA